MRTQLAIFLVCAALVACVREATEVLVVVDSNVPAAQRLRVDVRVSHSGSAERPNEFYFDRARSADLPASFAVVPAPGEPAESVVQLDVRATLPDGSTLRQVSHFRFVAGRTTQLRVFLNALCAAADARCGNACTVSEFCDRIGQTCGNDGLCRAVTVTPSTQPVPVPYADARVEVVQIDTGPRIDATLDAPTDRLDVPRADATGQDVVAFDVPSNDVRADVRVDQGGSSCGGTGQTCCAGSVCSAGNECAFGSCRACGLATQPCCGGSSCSAGNECAFGSCRACGLA
ncbi:MAG: hypothetical protein WCJ30_19510, partial [Deltaproteobacteria bacterium]